MPRQKLNKQTRGQGNAPEFPRLLGERLCLDFANTVEGRLREQPRDFLDGYVSLIEWGYHAGALPEAEYLRLLVSAQERPKQAQTVYRQALKLREAIYRVFLDSSHHAVPAITDLQKLRDVYLGALKQAELALGGEAYTWTWKNTNQPEGIIWSVSQSAIELLTSPDVTRVKQCPGCGDCGWLFVDTSKNSSRKWCSMEGCGSRVKMRRQYQRHHKQAG